MKKHKTKAHISAGRLLDALSADGYGDLVVSVGVGATSLIVYGKKARLGKALPAEFDGWPVQFVKTSVKPA